MADRFRRVRFVHEIASRPLFKAVVIVLAVLGTASTVRELLFQEQLQAKLNFYKLWSLSWPWYVWVIVVLTAVLIVVFQGAFAAVVKRQKMLEDLTASNDVTPIANLDALRKSVLFLSNEINQFAQERNDTRPTMSPLHLTHTLGEQVEFKKGIVAHRHETVRWYYTRFGARVSVARDDLAAITLTDERLDELYAAPAFNEEISEIAECLRLLAERIPTRGAAQDTSSLHEANTRLENISAKQQAEGERQRAEIARLNTQIQTLSELKPRTLTAQQRAAIAQHVTPVVAPPLNAGRQLQVVVSAMPSSDCASYAQDFEELLSSLGLTVRRYPRPPITYTHSLDDADDLRKGITVLFNPEHYTVPYPQAFIDGLKDAAIEVNVLERVGSGIFFHVVIGDRQ